MMCSFQNQIVEPLVWDVEGKNNLLRGTVFIFQFFSTTMCCFLKSKTFFHISCSMLQRCWKWILLKFSEMSTEKTLMVFLFVSPAVVAQRFLSLFRHTDINHKYVTV